MFKMPEHIKVCTNEAKAYFSTKYAKIEMTHIRSIIENFDAADSKGRVHGYRVSIGTKTITRTAADERYRSLVDDENLGEWFTARPQALRAGQKFGALQTERHFRTLEEAEAEAAKMIERARKTAAKKR